MRKQQSGFTLIELVAVIVIIGALAVVALPRFINLQDDAEQAATEGVGGALASAAAVNYAGYLADDQTVGASNGAVTLNSCDLTQFNGAMQQNLSTSDYTLTLSGAAPSGSGDAFECTITGPGSSTAAFSAIATS